MKHPRIGLLIGSCCLLSLSIASAQSVLPFDLSAGSGSTAVDFELRLDGSLLEKGAGTSTLTNADIQASTVFLWYPVEKALRAGGASTETTSSIGPYSVAFGQTNTASGTWAFAAGYSNNASNYASVAMGYDSYAAYCAISMGQLNSSTGAWSLAIGGYGNTASGEFGIAMGGACLATGTGAVAIGYNAVASGSFSASFNLNTAAQAINSTAFGQYNIGGGNSGTWVATDPLFEIGNGMSSSARSDAVVVYKNGNADFQGVVSVAPGGDIPMYAGN